MLILASSSRYRHELLARLRLPIEVIVPDVDEAPVAGESPMALAIRLARAKTARVQQRQRDGRHPPRFVIGSDQVATLDGRTPIGKPGNHERAVRQLREASGRDMLFYTAVCVMRTDQADHRQACVTTRVRFRSLDDDAIERYLRLETPYDCAGSAKSEGLGISLLRAIDSPDPTALVGLPLIAVCDLLGQAGLDVLAAQRA
ncbi:MAG: Maf family nucleotide pyrophosphatase [Burkholderiaceae bacterium]